MDRENVERGVMNGRSRSSVKTGFTMVEVIVSLFLICLVMAGSYTLIVRAAALSRAARNHYVASILCNNRIERARNFDYEDLHLLEETSVTVNDNGYPDPDGWFSRTTTVSTNYLPMCTKFDVVVQIRNRKTGFFGQERETESTQFTEFLAPPVP